MEVVVDRRVKNESFDMEVVVDWPTVLKTIGLENILPLQNVFG